MKCTQQRSVKFRPRLWLSLLSLGALTSPVPSSAAPYPPPYSSALLADSSSVQQTARTGLLRNQESDELAGNVTGYVVPLIWLSAEEMPSKLTRADIPPALVTISFNMQGVTIEQMKSSSMQSTLQNITGNTTGTPGNLWTINIKQLPHPGATSDYNQAIPSDVLVAWGQCGGLGGVCGDRPGFDCKDAAFSEFICSEGHVCKRQNKWLWQCAEDPRVRNESADPSVIPGWQQCGGKGAQCRDVACADAAYPNRTCASGYTCMRKMEWYWQCMPTYMLAGRKLLKEAPHQQHQQQQQQQNATTAAVTMSLTAYNPQLIVYRLSQQPKVDPAAKPDNISSGNGCSTKFCHDLINAGLPIDGGSMQVQPELDTLLAQAAPRRTSQRSAGSESLRKEAVPVAAEQQQSAGGVHVGTIVGASFGALAGLLLLVLVKKAKDRCQTSAAITPHGPFTAESPFASDSEGKAPDDQLSARLARSRGSEAAAAHMEINSLTASARRLPGMGDSHPSNAVIAPVAYTRSHACSITAAAAAAAAAKSNKKFMSKPEPAESSSLNEMIASAVGKPTKSPEYPGTPSPQSSVHEDTIPDQTGMKTNIHSGTVLEIDSGDMKSSSMAARSSHSSAAHFLSETGVPGIVYSSSPTAAKAAGAAAAAAVNSDDAASFYSISTPATYRSYSSSVASAKVVPVATAPATLNIGSHMLLDVASTCASLRSSVASTVTTAGCPPSAGASLTHPSGAGSTRLSPYALASMGAARTSPHLMFASPIGSHAGGSLVRGSLGSVANVGAGSSLVQLLNSPTAARASHPRYPCDSSSTAGSSVRSPTADSRTNRALSPTTDRTLTPWA